MIRARSSLFASTVILSLALGAGCAPTGSDSVADLLSTLTGQTVTADTTLGQLLNELTIGDAVDAFARFAQEGGATRGGFPAGPSLTDEERMEIEAFQAEFDAGGLSAADFSESIRGVIGDRGAGRPFAGFGFYGAPIGHRMGSHDAVRLDLTEEQRAAGEEIFQATHDDIAALRDAAMEEIRALLTDEQVAALDELRPGDRLGPGRARGGRMSFGRGERPAAGRLTEELGLSDEQQASLEAIREDMRANIQARHEQARNEFLELLTDEQRQMIDDPRIDDSEEAEESK